MAWHREQCCSAQRGACLCKWMFLSASGAQAFCKSSAGVPRLQSGRWTRGSILSLHSSGLQVWEQNRLPGLITRASTSGRLGLITEPDHMFSGKPPPRLTLTVARPWLSGEMSPTFGFSCMATPHTKVLGAGGLGNPRVEDTPVIPAQSPCRP